MSKSEWNDGYLSEMTKNMIDRGVGNTGDFLEFLVDYGFESPDHRTVTMDYPTVVVTDKPGVTHDEDCLGNLARCESKVSELIAEGKDAKVEFFPRGYQYAAEAFRRMEKDKFSRDILSDHYYVDYREKNPEERVQATRDYVESRLPGFVERGICFSDANPPELINGLPRYPQCEMCGKILEKFTFRMYGEHFPGYSWFRCRYIPDDTNVATVTREIIPAGYPASRERTRYEFVIQRPRNNDLEITREERDWYLDQFEVQKRSSCTIRDHTFDRIYPIIPHDEWVMLENDRRMERERRAS